MALIYHHDNIGSVVSTHIIWVSRKLLYYDSPCHHGPCSPSGVSRVAGYSAGHTRRCEAAGQETGNPREFS